ncbi:MAG: hypothetical protein QM697_16210 [Lachnospiraceae bacterium]
MDYEIISIQENWIFIRHNYRDELDGFIMLIKSIEGELDGRIIQVDGSEIQYTIDKDPYHLIYRWDTREGIVVILENKDDTESVLQMLQYHFEKLSD